MPAVSIVVPVYKVEAYLRRCVDSLVRQTLRDIEIILVDDGSPDGCPALCDQLAAEDNRIHVVHKENGGLSSARNAGLCIATGKYVGFVDSDDDVELDMYEKLVQKAEQYAADFVMCDYGRILPDGTASLVTKSLSGGLYEKQDIRNVIFPQLIMGENVDYGPLLSACLCIYNREFLYRYKISFAEDVKWSEDNLFSSYVGYNAQRFYYIKGGALYHYYQNADSITTSYRAGAWKVYCRMNEYLREYFSTKKDFDFSRQIQLHILYYACNVVGMECRNAANLFDAVTRTKKVLHTPVFVDAMRNFELPAVSAKLRLQLFMMKNRMAWPLAILLRR